jgi:hypothetical protein
MSGQFTAVKLDLFQAWKKYLSCGTRNHLGGFEKNSLMPAIL